ncbi:hypothetical protein, partial [Microbacterium oxydans]|uniref:hypothetical protein n=1 Tax=Microbacterium oxydans TaxID=82380 RepID=UPI001E2EC608
MDENSTPHPQDPAEGAEHTDGTDHDPQGGSQGGAIQGDSSHGDSPHGAIQGDSSHGHSTDGAIQGDASRGDAPAPLGGDEHTEDQLQADNPAEEETLKLLD